MVMRKPSSYQYNPISIGNDSSLQCNRLRDITKSQTGHHLGGDGFNLQPLWRLSEYVTKAISCGFHYLIRHEQVIWVKDKILQSVFLWIRKFKPGVNIHFKKQSFVRLEPWKIWIKPGLLGDSSGRLKE